MKAMVGKKRAIVFWNFAWIAPLLLVLSGCGGAAPAKAPAPEVVSGLRVDTVRMETIPNEVAAPGTVASVRTAQIAARVMGTVEQVTVHEGDRVRQGQLLITLDDREFAARYAAAKAGIVKAAAGRLEAERAVTAADAQAGVAETTYRRYVYLRQQKSVSPQEFDEVQAKRQSALAMLAQAQARVLQADAGYRQAQEEMQASSVVTNYTRIVAPFDGVVLQRLVDPGSMATPAAPLLVLEESSRYRLEASVGAENAGVLRRGMRIPVALDAFPGKTFTGTVAEIEPGADPSSHTVQVKIDLPRDPALRSGLFGRAWFRQGERRAIVVPAGAIFDRGQLRAVYVVDGEGIIRLRLVTLGAEAPSGREVLSGLGAGDRVVVNPGSADLDDKKLEAGR
ncbi:MAG TPA: efflux RND transporter periplasmic adaptor subunit [Candidatus Dormibacteraeota bacterium]|nr:efflux RND transporter periplasmic adaptor subunit [Candidatus Dormibacteraeota bacterium]